MHTVEEIDKRVNEAELSARRLETRQALEHVPVDVKSGLIQYQTAAEVAYMGELYSKGSVMLPPHLRGSPGACALTLTQAIKWRLDFMFVASMQYVQGKPGEERVNYMSQIFRAILENSGMLKNRMRHEYIGEGDERRCRVWATFKGEDEPHEFISPTLKQLMPPRNEYGKIKGSPLWDRKPDLQMLYDTQRDWVRAHAPDLFSGVYDEHEFAENEHAMAPRDVSPGAKSSNAVALRVRLKENKRRTRGGGGKGFKVDSISKNVGEVASNAKVTTIDGETVEQETKRKAVEAARERGKADGETKVASPPNDLMQEGHEDELEAYKTAYIEAYPAE